MGRYRNPEEKRNLSWFDRGPGPAGYSLPGLVGRQQHAPTHRINPEYSMGLKLSSSFIPNSIGPGPGEYLIRGLKANGPGGGPEYTMRQKFPIPGKQEGPGPAGYEVPPPEIVKPKAPAYPIGSRTPLYNKKVSPGPIYLLPKAIGPLIPDKLAAAEVTLKGDRKFLDTPVPDLSPGPIYHTGKVELVKPKAPAFTMRIKWPQKSPSYEAGPASYEAKLPPCPCKTPQGPHMGIRYNEFTGIFRTPCDKPRFDSLD